MSSIRLSSIKIKNYRSFGDEQEFFFPNEDYLKPIAIIGYNNSGKTNLMNAILYGVGEKFVNINAFEKNDLHNLSFQNQILITSKIEASSYLIWSDYHGKEIPKTIGGSHNIFTKNEDDELLSKVDPSFFGANKHYKIFYINFHKIKDEISTKKTSWGNLTSFLAKHIQSLVDADSLMGTKKEEFKNATKIATNSVLENSSLKEFISNIKDNYSKNLRDNNCEIEFGLPEYEDIFLQMMFKIGLNGDNNLLIPIDHFGDGYISMFVMAVIQAIAESDTDDKCLFLFEEPESFLHENHQEYFYKMVLSNLAENGHQVIYTTHSAKMVDIFDTKSIIRIEFDEKSKQTIKKYNNIEKIVQDAEYQIEERIEPISIATYNGFIKSVEPNLNKILFSRKVILVEGPNDLMAYKFAIKKEIINLTSDEKYADSYLNFFNISILVHHGKPTAILLIKLCQHLNLEYFVITDLDFEENFINSLSSFQNEEDLKSNDLYLKENGEDRTPSRKGMITTNWKLIKEAGIDNIHFNIPKLERVLGYDSDDKNSLKIWERLNSIDEFPPSFFPQALFDFLELNELKEEEALKEEPYENIAPELLSRLVKASKYFNVGTKTIVEFLESKGFHIKNKPTAKLSQEMIQLLLGEFKKQK